MADYEKAAADLRARLDAKTRRAGDLDAFFEEVKASIVVEVDKANVALAATRAPRIDLRRESVGEPTMELSCDRAICKISQDRNVPSIGAAIAGEAGNATITFILLIDESPVTAQRASLAPAVEAKLGPIEIAATIVEELINRAPGAM